MCSSDLVGHLAAPAGGSGTSCGAGGGRKRHGHDAWPQAVDPRRQCPRIVVDSRSVRALPERGALSSEAPGPSESKCLRARSEAVNGYRRFARSVRLLTGALLLAVLGSACASDDARAPTPPGPSDGRWQLTFADEFDGHDLDDWNECFWWSPDEIGRAHV